MLRRIAAVPPDVRKGFVFPVAIEEISGCCAARVEAQPQRKLNMPDGKAELFRTSAGIARKTYLASVNDKYFTRNLI